MKPLDIANKVGTILSGNRADDVGVALGLVLANFMRQFPASNKELDDGIDAIATDAKSLLRTLRRNERHG